MLLSRLTKFKVKIMDEYMCTEFKKIYILKLKKLKNGHSIKRKCAFFHMNQISTERANIQSLMLQQKIS